MDQRNKDYRTTMKSRSMGWVEKVGHFEVRRNLFKLL
jgi:hypothetical protein